MALFPLTIGNAAFAPGMTQDGFLPDLVIGGSEMRTDTVTITGGPFRRGTVMGDITSGPKSGMVTIATAAATDGSATPSKLLVDDTAGDAGDVIGGVYLRGEFNRDAVLLGVGITLAAATAALERRAIYLKIPTTSGDPT